MQAKPSPSRRRLLRLALALPVLLALGHGLLWFWLVGQLEAGLAQWAAGQRAAGWQVAHATPRRGGWPWAATLVLPAVQLAEPTGLGWRADALELRLALPWPQHLALAASGAQVASAGTAELPFTTASLTGSLPLARTGQPLRLQAEALRTATPEGPPLLRRATLVLGQAAGAPQLDLALEGLALPALAAAAAALGPEVQQVRLQAALTVPWPANNQPATWRDAGGRLQLRGLEVLWGPVRAGGSGEMALDPALQPSGRATLTLAGLGETLDALVAAGLVPASNARSLGAMAMLLARAPAEGGPPRLELPLALRDRTLSVAGFTLARLPVLRWPAQ